MYSQVASRKSLASDSVIHRVPESFRWERSGDLNWSPGSRQLHLLCALHLASLSYLVPLWFQQSLFEFAAKHQDGNLDQGLN